MATKYIPFEQATQLLGVGREELIRMVSYGTIRAFRIQDQMKFRQRDIHGLRRIKKLLGRALGRGGGADGEPAPDPELWDRFQKGEIIDFEALQEVTGADDDFDPADLIGESVFTEALASHGGSVDALLDSMVEEPLPEPVSREIRKLAREVSGGRKNKKKKEPTPEPADEPEPPAPAKKKRPAAAAPPRASARIPLPEPFPEDDAGAGEGSPAIKMAVALGLLLLFGGILFWQLKLNKSEERLPQVLTGAVQRIELKQIVTVRGTLKALRQVNVTSGIRGVVEAIEVELGGQVLRGKSVVVRLKARELEDARDLARSELEAKQAALKEARINLRNARNLIVKEQRMIKDGARAKIAQARTAVDQAKSAQSQAAKRLAELSDELQRIKALSSGSEPEIRIRKLERDVAFARDEVARAARKVALRERELADESKQEALDHPVNKARLDPLRDNRTKAELAIQRLEKELLTSGKKLAQATSRLGETVVRAPISGHVSEIKVHKGDHVTPNGVLAVISDRSRMVVEAPVDETDIFKLKLGLSAQVQLEAFPDREFAGKVTRIATRGEKKPGSEVTYFPVDVQLDDTRHGMRPGLTSFVNITVERRPDALVVPIEAVQKRKTAQGAEKQIVFALGLSGEKTIAQEHEVGTGMSDNRLVELLHPGGLREGARIVVGPYRVLEKLNSGEAVEPVRSGR